MSYQSMTSCPRGFGKFFLVRPRGIFSRTGEPYIPTVVQEYEGELFTANDELRPLYWTKGPGDDIRNGPTTRINEAELEWIELPS